MLLRMMVMKMLLIVGLWVKLGESATSTFYIPFQYDWQQHGFCTVLFNNNYSNTSINFTLTYPTAYVSPNVFWGVISIMKIKSSTAAKNLNFSIETVSKNLTQMIVNVKVGAGTIIQWLDFGYFLYTLSYDYSVQPNWSFNDTASNGTLLIDPNYEGNLTMSLNVNTSNASYSSYFTSISGPNRLMLFMQAVSYTSTGGKLNQLQLFTETGYGNPVTIRIYKPLGVVIKSLKFTSIFYMLGYLNIRNQRYFRWGDSINITETGGSYITSATKTIPKTFTGLSFFKVINDTSVLDYQVSWINSLTPTIVVKPQQPLNVAQWGSSSTLTAYFHFYATGCTASGSYFIHVISHVCYDVCPTGTVNILYKCYPCSYDCTTCTSLTFDIAQGVRSTCLTCNSVNYRTMLSNKCVCVNSTYFDDGYSAACRTCPSVNSATITCQFTLHSNRSANFYANLFAGDWSVTVIPLFTSLSCTPGYVIHNNLCKTCAQAIPYCTACTNGSECTTCASPALKSTDGKCYLCSLTKCTMCSLDNVCSQCSAGYIPNANGSACIVEPCNTSCTCGGFVLPLVNGSCSTLCGDGIKAGTEQCDDGNLLNSDGCSSLCLTEGCSQNCSCMGYSFPLVNGSCTTTCGDGYVSGAEQCDDSNTVNHDGCSSTCKHQTCAQNCSCGGYTLPIVNNSCSTICGDGILAGTEECEDSNVISGDGCSSACMVENCSAICTCGGWALPIVNGTCSATCGDGILKSVEQCDDGNLVNYDGCSSTCTIEGCNKTCNCSGWTFPRVNGLCTTTCGDLIIAGSEECDDGNVANYDGCSAGCIIEPCNVTCDCDGWHFPRVNSSCTSVCGDGEQASNEECDDGNTQSHDGCSSICILQTSCSNNCSCDGWAQPYVNGLCSTQCGDGIVKGPEQCDDGNTVNNDGCDSLCKIQVPCNQSCSCNGWALPLVNGSCSTLCGDGTNQGSEQCDDGNTLSGDGCSDQCKLQLSAKMSGISTFLMFSQEKTYYPSLILFGMGFRVIGMQMLWVFQSFQLLQDTQQSSPIKISSNIHGYSDPQGFPFKIPGQYSQLFDKFNYMLFVIMFVFTVCTFLETLGECCRSTNQISNQTQESSPLSFSKGPSGLKQKEYKFEEERDVNDDFTVHYDKKSTYKNDLLFETRAISHQEMSELQHAPQPPTFFSRLSRTILRQFFFDMIMNVQPVLYTTLAAQIITNGVESLINFPTLITFGVVELFFFGILSFCSKGGEFFGENQSKFKENKFMNYWLVSSAQKVLFSIIIGAKFNNYLYVIVVLKFGVMVYIWLDKVYHSKAQNYRSIIVQFLHLGLFVTFAMNKLYLEPNGTISQLPTNFIEIIQAAILVCVFGITLAFFIKESLNKCSADNRQIFNESDEPIPERLFYSRRQVGQSGIKLKSNVNPMTESILDEIKSKKLVKNETVNSHRSKNTQRGRNQENQQREQFDEEQQYDRRPQKSKRDYDNRRQQQFSSKERNRTNNYRQTQQDFNDSGYNKENNRGFMKSGRRFGRQKQGNKENKPQKTRFEEQSQPQPSNHPNYVRSVYHNQVQNDNKQSRARSRRTHNDAKSRSHVREFEEESNDYDNNYDAVSIRFR